MSSLQHTSGGPAIASIFGWLFVLVGIAWLAYAFQFDTTTLSFESGDRVHNNGLLNDRIVHTLAAGFTLLFGVGLVVAGRIPAK